MSPQDKARAKAKRAFERRFGQSLLPLGFVCFNQKGRFMVRVIDRETGTWAEYDCSGWRIRRVAEHEGA